MNKIEELLLENNIKPHLKGFDYLVEAIKLIQSDKVYLRKITKMLYPTIAKNNNDTMTAVERVMRYIVQKLNKNQSTSEFLAIMVLKLKGEENE